MLNYRSDIKNGQYVFDIPSLANSIGVTAVDLLAQLQYLKVSLKCNQCYHYCIKLIPLFCAKM